MENLQAALRAVLSSSSPPEQITTIARQIAYFGYLSLDGLVWVSHAYRQLIHAILFLSGKLHKICPLQV